MADEKPPPGRHPGIEPRTVTVMGVRMPAEPPPPALWRQEQPVAPETHPVVAEPQEPPTKPPEPPSPAPEPTPQARPPLVRKVTPPPVPMAPSEPIIIRDAPAPKIPEVKTPSMIPGTHIPAGKAAIWSGVVLTLGGALIAILPQLIHGPSTKPVPSEPPPAVATQPALDQANKRINVLEQQVVRLGELVCAINQGRAGPDWPCDLDEYAEPRGGAPPKFKTDRSFPE